MPDSILWRTLTEWQASPVDFLIVLLGVIVVLIVYRMHIDQKKEIDRLREKISKSNDELWREIRRANERYHRLDTLNFGMAKAIQSRIKVKLIKEDANGDGDYAIDRSV